MTARDLVVISAGLGRPSATRMLADRLAAATSTALRELGVESTSYVVELRDHAHEITDNLLTGFPGPRLAEVVDRVVRADALIAVTPIFNASYSGLFKSFLDVLEPDALTGRPVLLGATGGTPRHSLALEHALRPVFTYLHALVVPTAVYAATADWGGESIKHSGRAEPTGQELSGRIERAGRELAALLTDRRPAATRVDPFDEPTPFERLLTGGR